MNDFVAKLRTFAAANRFSLTIGGVALLAVLASFWVAVPARKEKAVLAAEETKLEALIKSSNLWVTQFQPASNEESAVWQATATEIDALGVKPSERLTLAQVVARRAEDAGFANAHIKFVQSASTGAVRAVTGVSFNPAGYKLQVSGVGNLPILSRFLGSLPPAVAVEAIALSSVDGGVATTLTLSVFEPAGTNVK